VPAILFGGDPAGWALHQTYFSGLILIETAVMPALQNLPINLCGKTIWSRKNMGKTAGSADFTKGPRSLER
jgi:hypothetical protein